MTFDIKKIMIGLSTPVILFVDLVLAVAAMYILAPGPIERVGFVAMGLVMVFLCLPAYLRGKRFLWALFATLIVFLGVSFVLESTAAQGRVLTVSNDSEIARIDANIQRYQAEITAYDTKWDKASNRAARVEVETNRAKVRADLDSAESYRRERVAMIEAGNHHVAIKADDVFSAIPNAIKTGRWIPLIFYVLFLGGMQYAVIAFAGPTPRRELHHRDYVAQWVEACYISLRSNKTTKIISKESFDRFFSTREGYPEGIYKRIRQLAIDNGIIGPDDEILERDAGKAIEVLRKLFDK